MEEINVVDKVAKTVDLTKAIIATGVALVAGTTVGFVAGKIVTKKAFTKVSEEVSEDAK